jgi:hypothetical protein
MGVGFIGLIAHDVTISRLAVTPPTRIVSAPAEAGFAWPPEQAAASSPNREAARFLILRSIVSRPAA